MDTHVLHILLLLAITVVCIGVSVGVKYDKSQIAADTHPDMSHGHVPDENYQNLSTELQRQINSLNSQVLLDENDINEIANNFIPSLDSSNLPTIFTPGTMDLDDFAKLFPSESWLNAVGYGYVGYNTGNSTSNYQLGELVGHSFTITYNNNMYNTGSEQILGNGSSKVTSFKLTSDGFITDSNNKIYYMTSQSFQNTPSTGNSIKEIIQKNGSAYIFRLQDKSGKIKVYQGVSSPPLTTCLYRLEYFGLTDDNNLPSGYKIGWIEKSGDQTTPPTLNSIPQSKFSNTMGLFASVYSNTPGAPPNGTDITDYVGFKSTISSDYYSISVLNSNILNSGNIPDGYTLSVPSNKPLYNIPANGQPFYSIHLVLLTGQVSSQFYLKDTNNTPGVQNVVIFCTSEQYQTVTSDPVYTQLARGSESVIISQDINFAFLAKQLYNLYPNYVPVNFVFFPLYYETQKRISGNILIGENLVSPNQNPNVQSFDLIGGYLNLDVYSYEYNGDGDYVEYKLDSSGTFQSN
jgi:hypothetical protein